MPRVFQEVDQMTVSEKLNMMDYIWNTLVAHHVDVVPAWHADVLAARRRKIESGEAEFMTIEESEAAVETDVYAR